MRVLVGLGNPGPRYFATRHNLGFELIDRFAARHGIAVNAGRFHGQLGEGVVAQQRVVLFKPMTFMNLSGMAVAELVGALPELDVAAELLLVYDDLDLPCAQIR
ncbi:MAG: aminoacyl-tRNA hydrolase, partial [Myxococcota bacterium]|nr:aminoacyl-tRNA hydrolase [Myxococcota bacterium]